MVAKYAGGAQVKLSEGSDEIPSGGLSHTCPQHANPYALFNYAFVSFLLRCTIVIGIKARVQLLR